MPSTKSKSQKPFPLGILSAIGRDETRFLAHSVPTTSSSRWRDAWCLPAGAQKHRRERHLSRNADKTRLPEAV